MGGPCKPIIDVFEAMFPKRTRTVCSRCGVEPVYPDGCACYYVALREAKERQDMIGRLSKWQREQKKR